MSHASPAPESGPELTRESTPESTPERPFQFTLGHAAVWFVAVCFVLAMLSQWGFWGVVVCLVVAAVGVLCYGTYWGEWKLASAAAAILLIFAGAGVFEEFNQAAERIGPRRPLCQHKLKQIGLALHNYHDDYGCFPPAYIADATGRPMHSWRVLLLPYVEEKRLYEQYDFSEPWNGPRNGRLALIAPEVYRCDDDPSGTFGNAAFLAVTGATTMWPTSGTIDMGDIKDGPAQTLAVVEVENAGVNWLEPRDLALSQIPLAADARQAHGIPSPHRAPRDGRRGTWGLFADGSVRFLGSEISKEQLRALLTIDRGDYAQFDGK